ncbi:MAG: choice-of-anchor D domain-containing protein, partial [Planctomycetota bacterium]
GISFSADGVTWYRLTNLSGSFTQQTFDLDAAVQAAGISYSSDFRIKFQQYDNYPALSDGREFDNISMTVAAPEMEVLGNGQEIVDGDTTPSTVDFTDYGNVSVGGSLTRTFTIRNTGGAALNLTGSPMVQIIGNSDFTVAQPSSPVAANGGTTTFQIKFTPSGSGLKTATVWIANDDGDENPYDFSIQAVGIVSIQPQSLPYSQDFSGGQPGTAGGWEYYSDNEGRIAVVGGRLRMDGRFCMWI